MPGLQPFVKLGDRMVQEVAFIRPNCVLQIGFGNHEPWENVRGKADDMARIRMPLKIWSYGTASTSKRKIWLPASEKMAEIENVVLECMGLDLDDGGSWYL